MKNVLFAYNGRVEKDSYGKYYGNELNDRLVERYQVFGNDISFLVRTREIDADEIKGVMPFEHPALCIKEVPDFASLKSFLKTIFATRKIVKQAVAECDVLIARLPSLIGRLAIKEARRLDKPYLVEVVGCPWDALWNHSLYGKIYAPFAYTALKKQVKNSPFVLYVTNKFLQNRYPSFGKTVGITDVVLSTIDEENMSRRIEKIRNYNKGDTLIIGTAAGYDVSYKGLNYVIDAVAQLKDAHFRYIYEPVGKGTGSGLIEQIESLSCGDKVKLRGQIRHNEVFAYFDEIDLYIQPSKQEGLPRAVVEAMSRATPILGSRTGGIPELIDDKYMFEKGSVQQIVNILRSLESQDLEKMAKSNFEKSKNFKTKEMDKKRLDFYNIFKQSYQ